MRIQTEWPGSRTERSPEGTVPVGGASPKASFDAPDVSANGSETILGTPRGMCCTLHTMLHGPSPSRWSMYGCERHVLVSSDALVREFLARKLDVSIAARSVCFPSTIG